MIECQRTGIDSRNEVMDKQLPFLDCQNCSTMDTAALRLFLQSRTPDELIHCKRIVNRKVEMRRSEEQAAPAQDTIGDVKSGNLENLTGVTHQALLELLQKAR